MNLKYLLIILAFISSQEVAVAQDLATYTPGWLKDGIVDSGASHEPWMFLTRRNQSDFNQWQKEKYDYRLSEEYIKNLAASGVTLYHIFGYKGYGLEAEKEHLRKAAKAAEIAHKYGLRVNTYVQWNTMVYETFFNEEPKAETEKWYQMDVDGKPIMLHYGYQQSFRYRPCFNHKGYMEYYKEKILAYIVDSVKTDFIHFDNFVMAHPAEADHNPATIAAFREYLYKKFDTNKKRIERFGINKLSQVLPPMWNQSNRAEDIVEINDPVIQEWIGFRCWSQTEHVAECARYVRQKKKEIAIEVNPHGLTGYNIIWELAVNHSDLARYTNAFVTEEPNHIKYQSNVCTGKFRTYKMGRTTGNTIFTNHGTENATAESLALNRSLGAYNLSISDEASKKYLDFWNKNKNLYLNCTGAEKVAVLRSFPSMAYNTFQSHCAVNMAEQSLQQNQIPFDIIFDQQLEELSKYDVIILASQESLSDLAIQQLKEFVAHGGGLVITGNTAKYDEWRRLRQENGLADFFKTGNAIMDFEKGECSAINYLKGKVIRIPNLQMLGSELVNSQHEAELGFATKWKMPLNARELISAVTWCAGKEFPLVVSAPEWIGVSHDTQNTNDIIHLFSYDPENKTVGISLTLKGDIKKVTAYSPDFGGEKTLPVTKGEGDCIIHISELKKYMAIVVER